MNRKLIGGLAALVVVLVGVWLLWFRGHGNAPKDATDQAHATALPHADRAPAQAGGRPARPERPGAEVGARSRQGGAAAARGPGRRSRRQGRRWCRDLAVVGAAAQREVRGRWLVRVRQAGRPHLLPVRGQRRSDRRPGHLQADRDERSDRDPSGRGCDRSSSRSTTRAASRSPAPTSRTARGTRRRRPTPRQGDGQAGRTGLGRRRGERARLREGQRVHHHRLRRRDRSDHRHAAQGLPGLRARDRRGGQADREGEGHRDQRWHVGLRRR